MDTKRDESHTCATHLQAMLEEFRSAKQRQLVRRGITLWNGTAARHALEGLPAAAAAIASPLPEGDAGHD